MKLPFVHVSFPPGFNGLMPQQQTQVQTDFPVPSRVEKAMQFLDLLNSHTRSYVATNEMSIEKFKGRDLTGEERDTKDSALMVLRQYFEGKIGLDPWEKLRYEALTSRGAFQKAMMNRNMPTATMPCPQCKGARGQQCQLCLGCGQVALSPAGMVQSQAEEIIRDIVADPDPVAEIDEPVTAIRPEEVPPSSDFID